MRPPPLLDDPKRSVARLRNALRAGNGHVAVIAGCSDDSLALVEEVLEQVRAHAVFRIRAVAEEPLRDIERELGIDAGKPVSDYERQRALVSYIETSRSTGLPIFALILDAEAADAERLEHVRTTLECVPLAADHVRMIVIGAKRLAAILAEPAARAFASRIGTRLDITPETLEPIVMQAGMFADRAAACSLQRSLAEQIRDVQVARLDPPQGTLYSVRVVGLRTYSEIERAKSAIRRLGHDPVRIAAESRRRHHRIATARRPFWARLLRR
jgi:hypothetical protein